MSRRTHYVETKAPNVAFQTARCGVPVRAWDCHHDPTCPDCVRLMAADEAEDERSLMALRQVPPKEWPFTPVKKQPEFDVFSGYTPRRK